jgi:hypothetical protein
MHRRMPAHHAQRPSAEFAEYPMRDAGRGPRGHHADVHLDIVGLETLGRLLGALAHVQDVDTDVAEHLRHHPYLQQPGRVLGEPLVVAGEPADEDSVGTQSELNGDRLLTGIEDREQPGQALTPLGQHRMQQVDHPRAGEAIDVTGLPVPLGLPRHEQAQQVSIGGVALQVEAPDFAREFPGLPLDFPAEARLPFPQPCGVRAEPPGEVNDRGGGEASGPQARCGLSRDEVVEVPGGQAAPAQ